MEILTQYSPVQFQTALPKQADVVIIGAGIIGITTAWFLADCGLKVVVCEKGRVAGEQSSRNWGWIRQQGRDEAELPIMMESMSLWQELATKLEIDIGFKRSGSLYLFEQENDLSRYESFMSFAPDYGLNCELLTRQQINKLVKITHDKWPWALYTASDGRAEPGLAVPAMAAACAKRGVTIVENCAVEDIAIKNKAVDGVVTEQGIIRCDSVLCSGGVWSSALLTQAGIKLPQLAVKASVVRTSKAANIFDGNASGSNLAFRRRLDGGYTIAMTDYLEFFPSMHSAVQLKTFFSLLKTAHKKIKYRFAGNLLEQISARPFRLTSPILQSERVLNPIPTDSAITRLGKKIHDTLPELGDVKIQQSWSGMIDATPDAVPVMDESEIKGLFIATGFSGHGFGIGPAAGKIMANLIQKNAVEHDLARFRLSRFSDGSKLIPGPSI